MTTKPTPAQVEAEAIETAEVDWRGFTFTIPASADDWDVEVTLAFEEGKITSAVRGILGPRQWQQVLSVRPKNRDLASLYDAIAAALGLSSAGE